ncbi:hypothetical protein BDY21DRAFT_387663 [Lineolata rhizophorae]|uniref:DNA ligase D 3'-phosphoesterase domain-containing protein n=1 Tax=Lineolata rhizophorae TaxID=578093 RepID=A0A6A6NS65_9PEZI|nr:hypothetical protein BDY21DRAFT_387663 [Lineolata rhizophorae]
MGLTDSKRALPEANQIHPLVADTTSSRTDRKQQNTAAAEIEAGRAKIDDYLGYFTRHLATISRSTPPNEPRLSIEGFAQLYLSNQNRHGHHFIIHQHNHPVAGLHYNIRETPYNQLNVDDLRLQFSETSSVSFSVPYGLPGNPNSLRPGRVAVETRVHTMWSHLIETSSKATGSLLIWDTGEYSILPKSEQDVDTDDDSDGKATLDPETNRIPENEKLIHAFQSKYIRLRLHGTRLPEMYTIILRLPRANQLMARKSARSKAPRRVARKSRTDEGLQTTDTEWDEAQNATLQSQKRRKLSTTSTDEMAEIRKKNAYPGAENSIGSVHQRSWYLSLDRWHCGFEKSHSGRQKGRWVRQGFETFFVRGAEFERSVVTGRLSGEVMSDEGVTRFVERKMWRPILECYFRLKQVIANLRADAPLVRSDNFRKLEDIGEETPKFN